MLYFFRRGELEPVYLRRFVNPHVLALGLRTVRPSVRCSGPPLIIRRCKAAPGGQRDLDSIAEVDLVQVRLDITATYAKCLAAWGPRYASARAERHVYADL